ncbi:DUF2268 domain-containing protein [Ornithinibacillus bavariensis]|uniref:DUF2268 domain-containing protein n=1 Tax=Ornithinibacillus bavariensis TaxID=545502 RepID=UPI003D1CD4C8
MKQLTVIRTDKWLEKAYQKPDEIFKKLSSYFDNADEKDVAMYLTQHGMYYKPVRNGEALVESLRKKNVWGIVQQEEEKLSKLWKGNNIPIFIFPSNTYNRQIMEQYNGRSGLSFRDKLFLFISDINSEDEIRALFTHEYNHCCRLAHNPKDEKDYSLLDVIVLEGMAEQAVNERYGKELQAPWTQYYTQEEAEKIWKSIVQPNADLPKSSRRVTEILYGKKLFPHMAGYCVGYYLVNRYCQQTGKESKDLLSIPSEKIAFIEK